MNLTSAIAVVAMLAAAFSGMAAAKDGDNWAERFPTKMTPGLERALQDLPEGAMLDVYAVMRDRMPPDELAARVRGAFPSERRRIVASVLRSFAEGSQKNVRAVLDQRGSPGAASSVRVLWLSNAIRFTGTAADIAAVRGRDEVGYIGLNADFPHESYQDAGAGEKDAGAGDAPGLPYYDGFETGAFGSEWTTATTGTGRLQVTTANGPIGTYHVTMDSSVDGGDSTCSLTLSTDLSGVTNCVLTFQFKEFSDEAHPEDSVSISADGVTFYTVLALDGGSTYEQTTVDLDEAAAGHGIQFSNDFKIRFSWEDNYSIPTDGFAFDEIKVEEGDPPPVPPEPNIVKLQAPDCWDIGITGQGALIVNLDSGTDYNHPDLVNRIWSNPGEIANGADDDGNGYIDDIRGWDFEYNDSDPMPDSSGHGTNTAGIVCGDGTSGHKTGMAPGATMAIAKLGDMASYWEAEQYAVLIGADVITSSYSYKWGIHDPDYHVFRTNCVNELIAGIIHANSIGNQGTDTTNYPIPFNISAPGNCPGPWIHPQQVAAGVSSVLGCAGIYLADDSLYEYSGQGPSAWEDMVIYDPVYGYPQSPSYWDYPYGGFGGGQPGLLKPDVSTYTIVRTTRWGGGYDPGFGGTSAATPHLGGAMALLVCASPEASPRKMSQALQETAVDLGPEGKDLRFGAGKVQVFDAALRLIFNIELDDQTPSLGSTIHLIATGPAGQYGGIFWSLARGASVLPGIGTLELADPRALLFKGSMPPSGKYTVAIAVPSKPVWIGRAVYFQGVMDDRGGATGRYLFTLVEDLVVQP